MTALLLMLPLVVTSTKAMIRRLGGKRWNRLHRLIYVIAILGVVHYSMAVKQDLTYPLIYAAVLAVLYGWRIVRWRGGSRNASPRPA